MSEPMWEYWRDKKGYERALVEQYPALLEKDIALVVALGNINANQHIIDRIMAKHEGRDE